MIMPAGIRLPRLCVARTRVVDSITQDIVEHLSAAFLSQGVASVLQTLLSLVHHNAEVGVRSSIGGVSSGALLRLGDIVKAGLNPC